jgi:hypothetical protein
MEPMENKSNSALIGVVVVILVLVIGGWYVWKSQSETPSPYEVNTTEQNTENSADQSSAVINAYAELDLLGQEFETTDTNVGVDVETIQ